MELLYSIKNIFSSEKDGVLAGTSEYYIPTYQRGYKWGTEHVEQLMLDMWDAYISNEDQYFLQYLTIKESGTDSKKVWEVIDGQQRLTTLSIMFALLNNQLYCNDIAEDKITYAIRKDLLKDFVREKLFQYIDSNWKDIDKNEIPDRQDLYYMHNAMREINKFLLPDEKKNNIKEFYDYILKKVFLILNVVDNVSGEEVFENMNSNKKPLTDIELTKAILLTLNAREGEQKSFKEIMEQRVIDGVHWDLISRWANDIKIKHFFGSKKDDGMETLFRLILDKDSDIDSKADYPIFSAVYKKLKEKKKTAADFFNDLKMQKGVLEKWYNHSEIYNLLGFAFFSKPGEDKIKLLKDIKGMKESDILKYLKQKREKIIKISDDLKSLQYGEHDDLIRKILLAVNVFFNEEQNDKFDFYAYTDNNWDIEHIFPKNPASKKDEKRKLYGWDSDIFNNLRLFDNIDDKKDDIDKLKPKLSKLSELKENESIELEKEETELLSELIDKSKYSQCINGIGNLCLLSDSVNRSIRNSMFYDKREKIVEHIINGHFVPRASFAVFSKMICKDLDNTLEKWTLNDMEKYREELERRYKILMEMK